MKLRPRHLVFPADTNLSKKVLTLALPVILGNLSRVLMNVVDVAMVGRLGAQALAAVGMGSVLIWTVLSFAYSFRTGVQTIASRRLGEQRFEGCGAALNNGLLFAGAAGVALSLGGYLLTGHLIGFLLDDPHVLPMSIEYTKWSFLSVFFVAVGYAYQGFFNGIERTGVHMEVTIASNIVNVYLNAGLIFGSDNLSRLLAATPLGDLSFLANLWTPFHFPALGVKGAALATLVASTWMMFHYMFRGFTRDFRTKYGIFRGMFDRQVSKRIVSIALPQGLQQVGVMMVFVLFFKITALVGTREVAATEVVFTIMQMSFLPAAGFGIACATLVGKYLGEQNPDLAEVSMLESVRWSIIFMGSMGLIFLLFPHVILPFFTNDQTVIQLGSVALRILGIVQFADAIGMTLWFALSGAGNTKYPAVVEMLIAWFFFLPTCYITTVKLNSGILGSWISYGLYIAIYATAITWKVLRGDWKEISI
ncbi:MAG: MATE family efflux transporter [Candidatus Neomarinimicrobiota bacterium]